MVFWLETIDSAKNLPCPDQLRVFEIWRVICKRKGMNSTTLIGIAAGVLTASSLIPQVIKKIKKKKAEDVSLLMLFILQAGIILWIVYGFKREDLPIILTNSVSLLVNITMVVLGIKYKKKPLG